MMTVRTDELTKQAYAQGAALALEEAGVDKETAMQEALAFAKTASLDSGDDLQKRAYLEGVTSALRAQGLDEKTAAATAEQWVNIQS